MALQISLVELQLVVVTVDWGRGKLEVEPLPNRTYPPLSLIVVIILTILEVGECYLTCYDWHLSLQYAKIASAISTFSHAKYSMPSLVYGSLPKCP